MEALELLELIQKGESSKVQFKERLPHQDSLAQEMVAFSNSDGGTILVGINDKTGGLNGLSYDEIQSINRKLVEVASSQVFPPIIISTETVNANGNNIILVGIKEGISKPYKDRLGSIYVKNGSDKRRVTSNDEIARLLQSSKAMYADELPVSGTSGADIDFEYFKEYINKKFSKTFEDIGLELKQALENLNLMKDGNLTLAGLLFFSKNRQKYRPQFSIQCVAVNSTKITGNEFDDNEPPFEGNLKQVFDQTISFIGRNLKKVPTGDSFNSQTVWEIPYEVFEELIVNSLIHRDYFITSTIKVFIFSDRIEIISPGKLPNSLTVENIISGISIPRNPILQSIAQHALPYKGLGTGIMRAVAIYPDIRFVNEQEKERFLVLIKRPSKNFWGSKIERQLISLKARVPHDIFVKDGIDYYNTRIHFRYPKSDFGKRITIAFKDASGQAVSQSIELKEGGQTYFQFHGEIESMNMERNFGVLQLLSEQDLHIEIWADEEEGGFF
jgi:predicted HTH transcriptional regulator